MCQSAKWCEAVHTVTLARANVVIVVIMLCYNFRIDLNLEQRANIKLYVKLGEFATETLTDTLVFKWQHVWTTLHQNF